MNVVRVHERTEIFIDYNTQSAYKEGTSPKLQL